MNNLIKNFCLILIILQFLCSCAITRAMWGGSSNTKYDRIDSFFIDKDQQRIVLIGTGNFEEIKDHWHYSISDPSGKIVRAFEIGSKSSGVTASFRGDPVEAKGSKICSSYVGMSVNKKNLSKEEIQKLVSIGFKDYKTIHPDSLINSRFLEQSMKDSLIYSNENHGFIMSASFGLNPPAIRYTSSKELVKNFCSPKNVSQDCINIIKLALPWQGSIKNNFTTSDHALRIVATPFALVADILLTPLYIIGVIGMGVGGR